MIRKVLHDELSPLALYVIVKRIFNDEITMLFESVINSDEGNFSFIVVGEMERLRYHEGKTTYTKEGITQEVDTDPFAFLKHYYRQVDKQFYQERSRSLGFSFTDGFIGFIGYDMVKIFEPTLQKSMDGLKDTLHTPDLDLIRPKLILAYDHKHATLTLIQNDGKEDMAKQVLNALEQPYVHRPIMPVKLEGSGSYAIDEERFKKMVDEAKEHIRAGDVFQILLSNRYTQKGSIDPLSFYRKLRSKNPSPYLFLLEFESFAICGSSPEVMVRLTNAEILLRPIAGTRKRGDTLQKDLALEQEMLQDPKECAEHLMLVDLGRNDVGRVARAGSVKVPELMRVERYSHVMHMVSDVIAKIKEDKDMFDLFRATFTAGTMTGAPKIKAMELIAAFEGLKRGFYSGSVGYFAFDGNMDSAIAIRTALIDNEKITLQAGAGVVADSKPELEALEVRNKLGALVATLKELAAI